MLMIKTYTQLEVDRSKVEQSWLGLYHLVRRNLVNHGKPDEALALFEKMVKDSDAVTGEVSCRPTGTAARIYDKWHSTITSSPIFLHIRVTLRPARAAKLLKSASVRCFALMQARTCRSNLLVKPAPQLGKRGTGAMKG